MAVVIAPPPATGGQRRPPLQMSPEELRRYARHLILPEIGRAGQERLKAARVLLLGAGGLGAPAGLYLAAAGVGTLGVVDYDVVEESNLHRQVLFGQADVGRPKLAAALERLAAANPLVALEPHELRLDSANALDLIASYDLVVDGTDNFPTRYLVNDACVLAGKPDVYGAIARFEGQVAVFWGARGPCYRCLFPEPPPPGLVPSCAEGGVLGVLPGVIGSLQASEAIKLILGVGEPLIGRLLVFEALRARVHELRVRKDPACPVCSENPTLTALVDYERFCAGEPAAAAPSELEIAPRQLAEWRAAGRDLLILDVRTPDEAALAALPGTLLLPLDELPRRLGELDPARPTVVHCHLGMRSLIATQLLREHGFANAWSLRGGIEAWSTEVDPTVPRY